MIRKHQNLREEWAKKIHRRNISAEEVVLKCPASPVIRAYVLKGEIIFFF